MKRLLFLVMTLILAVCLVAGCGGKVKAYSDPEETIGISPDKEFIILIALESNPTTGYSWEANYDEATLELVEETYEFKQGVVGAGGTGLFRFRALNSGEVEITMVYKRAWEEEILDQKVFKVDIKD